MVMPKDNEAMRHLVVGVSGASGTVYAVRILEVLRDCRDVTTHLVMTNAAKLTCTAETDLQVSDIEALADIVHNVRDIGASISSGSFRTDGMIIAPCSMRTLSAVVNSLGDNLLVRAADVVLKEKRRLAIMPRETPMHAGHCRLMHEAALLGAIICPPVPAFYNRPATIDDIVNSTVARVLDLFDIEDPSAERWPGLRSHLGL